MFGIIPRCSLHKNLIRAGAWLWMTDLRNVKCYIICKGGYFDREQEQGQSDEEGYHNHD